MKQLQDNQISINAKNQTNVDNLSINNANKQIDNYNFNINNIEKQTDAYSLDDHKLKVNNAKKQIDNFSKINFNVSNKDIKTNKMLKNKNLVVKDSSLHYGHRDRLRNKLLSSSNSEISEHELLEILLFSSIPRCDTNEIAHILINKFGNLSNVLKADPLLLAQTPKIKKSSIGLIKTVERIVKYVNFFEFKQTKKVTTRKEIIDFFNPYFNHETKEIVIFAYADIKGNVLGVNNFTLNKSHITEATPKEVLTSAISLDAKMVVMAHNHPNNVNVPSKNDILSTIKIKQLLSSASIDLVEHLIFGSNGISSIMKIVDDNLKRINDNFKEIIVNGDSINNNLEILNVKF